METYSQTGFDCGASTKGDLANGIMYYLINLKHREAQNTRVLILRVYKTKTKKRRITTPNLAQASDKFKLDLRAYTLPVLVNKAAPDFIKIN